MNYSDYRQTEYWKQVAEAVKERAGHRCQLCNSPDNLHAHHRTYSHYGKELDHLGDLTCLCDRCHADHHGKKAARPPNRLTDSQVGALLELILGLTVELSVAGFQFTEGQKREVDCWLQLLGGVGLDGRGPKTLAFLASLRESRVCDIADQLVSIPTQPP